MQYLGASLYICSEVLEFLEKISNLKLFFSLEKSRSGNGDETMISILVCSCRDGLDLLTVRLYIVFKFIDVYRV